MKTKILSVTIFATLVMISCTNDADVKSKKVEPAAKQQVEMSRQAINPENDWGAGFEMNQAEVISGFSDIIKFSGQTSLVSDSTAEMGVSVKFPNDQRKQMEFILKSIEDLLNQAGMSKKNIIHVTFYTTEMEGFLGNYDVYASWIQEANIRPTQSAIGVNQLVSPEMKLEIEVTGAR